MFKSIGLLIKGLWFHRREGGTWEEEQSGQVELGEVYVREGASRSPDSGASLSAMYYGAVLVLCP